jgi:hypothetical protein
MMDTVSGITETVAARLLAAAGSKDEFIAAYIQALRSFGKEIAGNAMDICTDTETPQGYAAKALVGAMLWKIRNSGGPLARQINDRLLEIGIPLPPRPKPKLHVIDGDAGAPPAASGGGS